MKEVVKLAVRLVEIELQPREQEQWNEPEKQETREQEQETEPEKQKTRKMRLLRGDGGLERKLPDEQIRWCLTSLRLNPLRMTPLRSNVLFYAYVARSVSPSLEKTLVECAWLTCLILRGGGYSRYVNEPLLYLDSNARDSDEHALHARS